MTRLIILNGTSSAGKTTLSLALRAVLPKSFCYFASDQLADAGFRPLARNAKERARFFDGFHRAVAAFAHAGNDLLVEHIVEEQVWADDLAALLKPFDVFWVGVHVPRPILIEREKLRGDRQIGEAEYHLKTHGFCNYDIEVQNISEAGEVAVQIVQAWELRASKEAS